MNSQTKLLFGIIKNQLEESEHPLNLLTRRFSFYFCYHYSDQILIDEKTNDYFLVKPVRRNEFDIRKISPDQIAKMEENYKNLTIDIEEEEDEIEVALKRSDENYFDFSIRDKPKRTIRKGTFIKQMH